MQTLTIKRAGDNKEIQTKFGPKLKQGVQFEETGDIWHDIWGGNRKEGDKVTGTRESRDYEGKTYWSFKTLSAENETKETLKSILNKLTSINLDIQQIRDAVIPQAIKAPTQSKYPSMPDYPEEEINPEDIPF